MKKINNLLTFINKFFREESNKILLGRWTINYCPSITKKKVDSGNHDHCGPCGIKNDYKLDDEEIDDIIMERNKEKIIKKLE
jgi:hypothetical protein